MHSLCYAPSFWLLLENSVADLWSSSHGHGKTIFIRFFFYIFSDNFYAIFYMTQVLNHWVDSESCFFSLESWVESNEFLGKPLEWWVELIQFLERPLEWWVESIWGFGKVSWSDWSGVESCRSLVWSYLAMFSGKPWVGFVQSWVELLRKSCGAECRCDRWSMERKYSCIWSMNKCQEHRLPVPVTRRTSNSYVH